jgi:hypothetical protein
MARHRAIEFLVMLAGAVVVELLLKTVAFRLALTRHSLLHVDLSGGNFLTVCVRKLEIMREWTLRLEVYL